MGLAASHAAKPRFSICSMRGVLKMLPTPELLHDAGVRSGRALGD